MSIVNNCIFLALSFFATVGHGEDFEMEIESIRKAYNLPALGVYSFVKGQPDKVTITGVRKSGNLTVAKSNDKFHFGSNGKAMTATLAAILVEDGLLSWDSKLVDLLPKMKSLNSKYRNVTFDMLLAHRSGVIDDLTKFEDGKLWSELWKRYLSPKAGRKLVIERILSVDPSFEPGTDFKYSNAGYIIAAGILEQLTGRSYEDLLSSRLWRPLAMNSCGFGAAGNPRARPPNQPWPHVLTEGRLQPIKPNFYGDNPPSGRPFGGMHCSMVDWAKFLRLHVDGFNGAPTPILKTSSFAKLHTPYPGDSYTYGGWIRIEHRDWAKGPVFVHEGDNTMNHAVVIVAPIIGSGIISVTNVGGETAGIACNEAISAAIQDATRANLAP